MYNHTHSTSTLPPEEITSKVKRYNFMEDDGDDDLAVLFAFNDEIKRGPLKIVTQYFNHVTPCFSYRIE